MINRSTVLDLMIGISKQRIGTIKIATKYGKAGYENCGAVMHENCGVVMHKKKDCLGDQGKLRW